MKLTIAKAALGKAKLSPRSHERGPVEAWKDFVYRGTRLDLRALTSAAPLKLGWREGDRVPPGKFWNLGDAEDMAADSFQGRFAGLLPLKPVDEKVKQMGRALLEAMGVKIGKWAGR